MKKSIVLTCFGAFLSSLYLTLFIRSFEYYSDEYGKSLDIDSDYLVLMLVGFILTAVGILSIVYTKKDLDLFEINTYGFGIIGLIMTFCPLGDMFRAIGKHKGASTIVDYLLWALMGAFILAFVIVYYMDNKKKKEN